MGDDLRQEVLADPGGDALDSLLAAAATSGALGSPASRRTPPGTVHFLEGRIFPTGM